MIGRIVGFISCLLCAIPFFIIAKYDRDSGTPINFWSGDTTLKERVKNVPDYNKEMADLYKKYAIVFCISGFGFLIFPILGVVMICFDCTIGIYIVYQCYKKILGKYE